MAALGVMGVMEEDSRESLTSMYAVSCKGISKWIDVMKENMDTRIGMCRLRNDFRRSSDDINKYY
jgi:hypothetical protein